MYQSFYILSNLMATMLFLAWLLATFAIASLARVNSRGGLRMVAWLSFLPLVVMIALNLGRALMMIQLASNDFSLEPTANLLSLPLLLPPLIAVTVWGFPRLGRLARKPRLPTTETAALSNTTNLKKSLKPQVDDQTRAEAAAPELVVPVQAGAFSAFLVAIMTIAQPSLVFGIICFLLLVGFGFWRWMWQNRLAKGIRQQGRSALTPYWRRLAWTSSFVLAIISAFVLWFIIAPQFSRLPESYSMTQHSGEDHAAQMASGMKMLSVTDLTGPKDGVPDRRFTLVAQKTQLKLSSGQTVEAWAFNGQVPGPELRAHQGDLVEVTLENRDIDEGVTIHWHGVDVPNAEDGVAGLTQDAVLPGQRFVYRFRVQQTGTYWYHSHQVSSEQVGKGLFGAFIIEPAQTSNQDEDITIAAHSWQTPGGQVAAFGLSSGLDRRTVAPGKPVRLRLINTSNKPVSFTLNGSPFQVAAIDGFEVNGPTALERVRLNLAAGGRYDLRFTMPDQPVQLNIPGASLLLSRDGQGEVSPAKDLTDFNPASYGQPAATPFGPNSRFDQEYNFTFEGGLGFYDGRFGGVWLINGQSFPNTPPIMVQEGDLIKVTFVNRTVQDHPMHPHGHKMLVLRRNGQPVTGSPWWTDTLNVAPGDIVEVAIKADNPGLWMDHCHDLDHASSGMIMHLMYEGVTTPFMTGQATRNHPE